MIIAPFLVLSVFLLTMQTVLFQHLPPWLGKPDLLFLLVVFLAYRIDIIPGAVLVLLIGFFIDIFSGVFLGLYPSIYLFIFFLLKATSKHIALNETAYQAPFAVISYLFAESALYISISILAPDNTPEWSWRSMLLQLLLLAVLAMPLFGFFDSYMALCTKKLAQLLPLTRKSGNRFKS